PRAPMPPRRRAGRDRGPGRSSPARAPRTPSARCVPRTARDPPDAPSAPAAATRTRPPPPALPRSSRPPFALAADHDPLVHQPLRLQLEPRQRTGLRQPHTEPQPLVRLGQCPPQPLADRVRVTVRYLHEDLDLVADPFLRVQVDLELVDLRVLADHGLHGARVHIRPPNELH